MSGSSGSQKALAKKNSIKSLHIIIIIIINKYYDTYQEYRMSSKLYKFHSLNPQRLT